MERLTWRKLQALIPQVKEPDKQIILWCEDEDFGAFAWKPAHPLTKHLKPGFHTFLLEDGPSDVTAMNWNELKGFILEKVEDLDDELTVIFGQDKFYINEFKDDALFAIEDYYAVSDM